MRYYRKLALAAALLGSVGAASGALALEIVLIDTGGVAEGTAAFTGFRAAADYWESVITDDVTLTFNVGFTTQGFAPTTLGSASSSAGNLSAATWRTAMMGDATTALDSSVVANLAPFSNSQVRLNTSLQKALGVYAGSPTNIDATIRFNSARPFDFDTRDGFANVASDFVSVSVHEMGHALGFTSAVAQSSTLNSRPTNTDMFRYKNGVWDMTWAGNPYFSIDGGATEFVGNAGFSAGPDGFQTSHWREGVRIHNGVDCTVLVEPQVGIHDPTGGLCQQGIVTAADLAIMDAMGWDLSFDILGNTGYSINTAQILQNYLNSVPEPQTWAMLVAGFGFVGGAMRRRNAQTAVA